MNQSISFILISVLFCLALPSSVFANEKAESEAIQAAKTWLTLVDQGKNSESWKEAAHYFKNVVTKEQWSQTINGVRKPLGKLISRELKSKVYATTLPGAPDGEYVVIQFKTSFENKKSAVETVTPMRDKDGTWRVSGYFIK
ncbi:DUF4019 domain-containing protein [candidate division CSSED10-310 bacterium]|uniref:DUF4019 domain-containing protein n=1 Tax=candidate division CSSED10-310 bacterium TaxID=2855610 RepID=A0ABV6YVI9_UNCC1